MAIKVGKRRGRGSWVIEVLIILAFLGSGIRMATENRGGWALAYGVIVGGLLSVLIVQAGEAE